MFKGLICSLVLISHLASAQDDRLLTSLIQSYPARDAHEITSKLNGFVSTLHDKRNKHSDQDFLRVIFRESHRKFFKNYKPYTQFPEIFDRGNYDCLSATSFLSFVLNEFGYTYKIIETNYHIFISVETNKGTVLLESTDRFNGIVTDAKKIEQRIANYRANTLALNSASPEKIHYEYNLNLYQLVKPEQLPGLLYFNQAVIAFNEKDLVECANKLLAANKIYESPRAAELAALLIHSVIESSMEEAAKVELVKPFLKYYRNKNSIVASL